MIVIDASALVAILFAEPEAAHFTQTIAASSDRLMSPVNFWETSVRATRVHGEPGRAALEALIERLGIDIVPIDADQARLAADVFARFGRGTPAGLNLGDCFAYALATTRSAPLLYKGGDFALTDIQPA